MQIIDSFRLLDTPDDPFEINRGGTDGRALHLSVSYSGGCEAHEFSLWATPELGELENLPVKELLLTHNGNGDACEALITEEIVLNLGPLARLHPDARVILVGVNEFDELFEFVVPRPNGNTDQPGNNEVGVVDAVPVR